MNSKDSVIYARPKTRGELRDKLQEGIECEVVASNVSITNILLSGWMDFKTYKVRPSENEGWAVYYPSED